MAKTELLPRPKAEPQAALPPFKLASSLLVAGLVTSLVAIGAGALARLLPGWQPGTLVAACFLVAVEAALVRYRMQAGRHLELGALGYLAAELFSLAVLMRVVTSASAADLGRQVAGWVASPLAVLDAPFVLSFVLGLLVALVVRGSLRQLALLEPRGGAVLEQGLDAEFFRAQSSGEERAALAQIAGGLGWGAALALLGLAVQMLDFERFGGPPVPLRPAAGLAGVVYLVCAVLFYSRARLGLLRSGWTRDGVAVEPAVLRRWRWVSVALVLAVVGAGLLLPRGYGVELVGELQGGLLVTLNLLSLLALFLGAVAVGALGLVLTIPALLLALLGSGSVGPAAPSGPLVLPTAPVQEPQVSSGSLLPGVVFWSCMAVLAVAALWAVLRRQEWVIALGRRLRDERLHPLLRWLGVLLAGAAAYAQAARAALAASLERATQPPAAPRPTTLRLRELGPRALIRACYAALLMRTARNGFERRRDETPHEYGQRLRARLPDDAVEVDALTDAFVAAAYAPVEPTPEQARRARGVWARLRRALRRA